MLQRLASPLVLVATLALAGAAFAGNGAGPNQNGGLVAQDWAAFWPSNEIFILSSPAWTSGAADCTADLGMFSKNGKWKVLASTSFHVNA
jgi:hypothetical protein